MEIDAKVIKELREKTGAGVMDCKKALTESKGDFEKAAAWLRENGVAQLQKRADRVASEGAVGSYIHAGGKLGVLVEVNCETDFAAKGPDFQTLVKEIAMQVAAANPRCINRDELPPEVVEQERQIYAQQAAGKPDGVVAKIVEGKLDKFFKETCLMEQSYLRDPNRTVTDLIGEYGEKIREKIEVRRFVRFQLGEALDQKEPA